MAGKSAYELSIEHGFIGTEEEWFAKNGDTVILKQIVDNINEGIKWKENMNI